MGPGPFLRRELATSARTLRAFKERRVAAILAGSILLAACLGWDWQGWDRSSILGAHRFGLAVFGMMVAGLVPLAMGVVIQQVAAAIASERDRKSLDALLASRFSSFEIVMGAVATGLFRYANVVTAAVPVVVLLVYLGGVAPIWAALAAVGLASTASLLAGFSVAASVGAKTASRAAIVATSWFGAWFSIPTLYLLVFRPFVWPGAPGWLTSAVVVVLESSPLGLLMKLLGLLAMPGGPIEAVGRMAGLQLLGASALVAWASFRLRPASRGLYDVEGERGRIRRLKAALRRPSRRPPCPDDPMFWREAYSTRDRSLFEKLSLRLIVLTMGVALVAGTWYFAAPAFAELVAQGYGPAPEGFVAPELNPLMRLLIKARLPALATNPAPGQARLEFNIVLRVFEALAIVWFDVTVFSLAFDTIKAERRRDTWLGLLATPLESREILRGKALGSLWKLRWGVLMLVAPGTVGLLAGAVHPLGYLAALTLLAASGAFHAGLGLLFILNEWDPETQGKSSVSLLHVPTFLVGGVVVLLGPMALAWAGLLTYEDVAALLHGGPFPELCGREIADWVGARGIVLAVMAGIGSLAFGAWWLDRANERGFDAAVGRPVRRPTAESGSTTPRPAKLEGFAHHFLAGGEASVLDLGVDE